MSDITYLVALLAFPQFGARRIEKIRRGFSSYKTGFEATGEELISAGLGPKVVDAFLKARQTIHASALMEEIEKQRIQVISLENETYPYLLKEISDPPAALFVRGEMPSPSVPTCAVVGSRKCTAYGRQVCREITEPIAKAGVVIASGLAFGIDTVAHEAAIAANGITVAVLASGLDKVGSQSQTDLANRILDHGGAIISEFPLGTPPTKYNFPIRNRIISGMSTITLVVEATQKSGSLITAREALEQNREVFAVPGPITSPTSAGTNSLIKMGAHLASSAGDILDLFEIGGVTIEKRTETLTADTKEEALILPLLSKEPCHKDELVRNTSLSIIEINSTLTLMEIKGKIRHVGGNYYIIGG